MSHDNWEEAVNVLPGGSIASETATPATGARISDYGSLPLSAVLALCLFVSIVHGLPHLLIPLHLSSSQQYTPFATDGVSALTYDESYIYAAQANYTYSHSKPAYDTDLYEYRDIPAVFPFVPSYLIAALARISGGIDRAFILSYFLFPPIAFLLIYGLVSHSSHSGRIGAVAGLFTILVAFGPRNFFGVIPETLRTGRFSAIQPLEYSRLLHPQLSFTLFLAALYLLWLAINRPSISLLLANGVAGGTLFYVYAYYWPVWLGACLIICFVGWLTHSKTFSHLWVSLAAAVPLSAFFWINYFAASQFPNYIWRSARFGLEHGHVPPLRKIIFTLICTSVFGLFLLASWFLQYRARSASRSDLFRVWLFWGGIFVAACCALNIEIVTGMNVESMEHYPNRLFQPFLCLAFFGLVCPALAARFEGRARIVHAGRTAIAASIVLIGAIAIFRQTVVASNTAPMHVYNEERKALYEWLNRNTPVDSVVMVPVSELSYLLPAYTHDYQWIPSGTRTTASNEEILDRFLIAAKLTGQSEQWVKTALAQSTAEGNQPLGHTYVYYLFQGNYNSPDRRLRGEAIEAALERYKTMDLQHELSRFRLDYIYARGSGRPQTVPGYGTRELYRNSHGAVYSISAVSADRASRTRIVRSQ
jgi:hypothetical protein